MLSKDPTIEAMRSTIVALSEKLGELQQKIEASSDAKLKALLLGLKASPQLSGESEEFLRVLGALIAARAELANELSEKINRFDFTEYLERQHAWSKHTFGPDPRVNGITSHIRKELDEILADPTDVTEWIDVAILALDGAWRAGYTVGEIISAMKAKQEKNLNREWPDWRTVTPDTAIEHIRVNE